MTEREKLEQFFQTNQIQYTIPEHILTNESLCTSIYASCTLLFTKHPSVFNRDTFDALCHITRANLEHYDFGYVANCFVSMEKAKLLTQENIQALVQRVINAPPRPRTGLLGQIEVSCAQKLKRFFCNFPSLTQDIFTFIIQSNVDVSTLSLFMFQLNAVKLATPANCQALLDSGLTALDLSTNVLNVATQEEFNRNTLTICDDKLSRLDKELTVNRLAEDNTALAKIHSHALSLYKTLCEIRKSTETQEDPRHFLHLIVSIHKALPTEENQPTKADLDELIALANVSEGHPSSLWNSVGKSLMILGALIAMAAGIVLTLGTVGSAISIAGASAAGLSALTGTGFFAYGNSRTGLSKNIMDLAEDVQQQQLSLLSQ